MEGQNTGTSGKSAWSYAPIVNFDRDDRKLKLNANDVSNRNRNYASPAFRERSPIKTPPKRGVFLYETDLIQPPNMLPAVCRCD